MFLFGTELFFAFWMASKRVGLPSGSTPPVRAATSMFLISFAKSLPRLASITAFLCFVVAHLEWPDICLLLRVTKFRTNPRDPTGIESPGRAHHLGEVRVEPVVPGQFRVEGGGEGVPLTYGHDVAAVLGDDLRPGAHGLDPGGPDEHALDRPAVDPGDLDGRLEGLVLPPESVT